MTDVLHLTNGDSTVATLLLTSLGGDVFAWRDALHEGPVPAAANGEFRAVRARFLSEQGWGDAEKIEQEFEQRDATLAAALRQRRPVVLWFEHDLYDQLQLLQILALVAETGHEPDRLELINIGTFPGRPDFKGLGELTAGELETLWSLRRPVDDEVLATAVEAWTAVRAPEPAATETFRTRDSSPMPFLAPALGRLLEELPDRETGLSRSERQLLEPLLEGPRTPWELFLASGAREEAPFEGDAWTFARIDRLAGLLAPADGDRLPPPPPRGDERRFAAVPLVLTDDGRRVLAGDADSVQLLGIDRWVGGTHLTTEHVWRWDARAGRVV